jgi:hypothetical protein
MDNLSPTQQAALTALERRGFSINRTETFEGDEYPTVFLSNTRYAEIEPDGSVNGEDAQKFLASM